MTRQYDYVDEYIAMNLEDIGAEFSLADYRDWMIKTYPSQAHKAAMQLAVHRQSPGQRTFTTECLRRIIDLEGNEREAPGMGPNAFYRVIETEDGVEPNAVLRGHLREAEQIVNRWEAEARNRMEPIAYRSKKAQRAFEMAKAEIKAVALMLHTRMRYYEEEEGEEEAA